MDYLQNTPEQETLEEVAERLYPIIETNDYMDWYDKNYDIRNSFIAGYKLAQEKMYSDIELFTEELKDRIDSFEYSVNQNSCISDYIKEWFNTI